MFVSLFVLQSGVLISERCMYNTAVLYTVDVSDTLGTIASNGSLPYCNESTCSANIILEPDALRENYFVRVHARNIFGSSSLSVPVGEERTVLLYPKKIV